MEQVYKLWNGRSFFACGGRFMMGEPSYEALFTWVCIIGVTLFYGIVAAPSVWKEWHPLLPLCTLAMLAVTLALLLSTCCSDPGVIPRREVILSLGEGEQISELLGYNVLGAPGPPPSASSRDALAIMVPPELRQRGYKWCNTCEIVRPPRSSHCPYCDQCVLRFDHHCPFVMNCIGQRNYHTFVGFICSLGCLSVLVIPMLLWAGMGLSGDEGSDDGTYGSVRGSTFGWIVVALAMLAGLLALGVLTFLGYHLFLIFTGQTTKEHWRGRGHGPLGLAFQHDAEPTLLAARGPRLFDPRAWVSVRDFKQHLLHLPNNAPATRLEDGQVHGIPEAGAGDGSQGRSSAAVAAIAAGVEHSRRAHLGSEPLGIATQSHCTRSQREAAQRKPSVDVPSAAPAPAVVGWQDQ